MEEFLKVIKSEFIFVFIVSKKKKLQLKLIIYVSKFVLFLHVIQSNILLFF